MHKSECSPNGVIICQQGRTQDLNDRIFSRMNPFFHQPPRFNSRSISTVRSVLPVIGSNEVCNREDVKDGFNVDLETVLQNRVFALQKSELNEYVPSSKSMLYNKYVPSGRIEENKHPLLSQQQPLFYFNPNKYNLGNQFFHNSTRTQLLNIQENFKPSR